jgi:hypothetical protein
LRSGNAKEEPPGRKAGVRANADLASAFVPGFGSNALSLLDTEYAPRRLRSVQSKDVLWFSGFR